LAIAPCGKKTYLNGRAGVEGEREWKKKLSRFHYEKRVEGLGASLEGGAKVTKKTWKKGQGKNKKKRRDV